MALTTIMGVLGLQVLHGAAAAALTAEALYARLAPSVWIVQTFDAEGLPKGLGSAVVTAAQTLVTNCHVLALASSVKVRREQVTHPATLQAWDPQRDLCLLKAPGLDAPPVLRADATQLNIGQALFAIGTAGGLESTLSSGMVTALRRNKAGQLVAIQFNAAISPGSSGGGLFDSDARLVGLPTQSSIMPGSQNLNFALPIHWLDDLPARHARLVAVRAQGAMGAAPPAVDDLRRLPSFATAQGLSSYRTFLGLSHPRAFVMSQTGEGYYASGDASTDTRVAGTPMARAMRLCVDARRSGCRLHAVDDEVVVDKVPSP